MDNTQRQIPIADRLVSCQTVRPLRSTTTMEACLAVEREQDKVLKKLRTLSGSASEKLQEVIDQVNALKEQFSIGKHLICILFGTHHKKYGCTDFGALAVSLDM